MTGFETKFFCNSNIAHFRFNFGCKFSEKLTVCVSFGRSIDPILPTDEIKGSIIAPSLVTAIARF
jgi:hypothetical protein